MRRCKNCYHYCLTDSQTGKCDVDLPQWLENTEPMDVNGNDDADDCDAFQWESEC